MADGTHIQWTDATWNPVRGCSRVSPGCGGANHEGGCYAEKIAARFSGPGQPFEGFAKRTSNGGQWTGKLALFEKALDLPLRWRKPRRIFVNSMSDLFHENLPDEAIDRVFAVMALAPQHTFQVLTKRAERMRDYLGRLDVAGRWAIAGHRIGHPLPDPATAVSWQRKGLPQVWLGVSVEDQARADERIPLLLETPAAEHFISAEPLLGPLDIRGWLGPRAIKGPDCYWLDWVIVGGESGPNARPVHPEWVRSLRDQCQAAGVAFFFKQWGSHKPPYFENRPGHGIAEASSPVCWPDGQLCPGNARDHGGYGFFMEQVRKGSAGRLLDGKEWSEFPA